ncbi:hypothetical protein BJ912DRAFT_928871 [Pholiota molesta]|nr:hypothetical protein BJ912DRAFT_928871 [Pholiota molesta]
MPPHPTSSHARVTNDGNESVQDADEASSMLLHDAGRMETPHKDSQAIREYTPLSKENSLMLSKNRVAPCENSDTSRENSPTPSNSNSKALEAYHTYWKGALQHIIAIARNLNSLKGQEASTAVHVKLSRMSILRSYIMIMHWIDWTMSTCHYMCANPDSDYPESVRWLQSLMGKVQGMIENRSNKMIFYPATFGIDMGMGENCCSVKRQSEYVLNPEELGLRTVNIIHNILCKWTGVFNCKEQWKTWMIDIMLTHFGPHILSLDETWNIFIDAKKFSIICSSSTRPTLEQLQPFAAALMTHPLSNSDSTESKIV